MKTEDFERLKKLCDENGFGIFRNGGNVIVSKKKDIWDGVEFAKSNWSNKIYPISQMENKDLNDKFYIPSTEQEYVEQLKKEAFERFGEINNGDRFDLSEMGKTLLSPIRILIGLYAKWGYNKENDLLTFNGFILYRRGKWAKKLDQPTKVNVSEFSHFGTSVQFKLLLSKWCEKSGTEIGDYLAKCLEDYLNGDAK